MQNVRGDRLAQLGASGSRAHTVKVRKNPNPKVWSIPVCMKIYLFAMIRIQEGQENPCRGGLRTNSKLCDPKSKSRHAAQQYTVFPDQRVAKISRNINHEAKAQNLHEPKYWQYLALCDSLHWFYTVSSVKEKWTGKR